MVVLFGAVLPSRWLISISLSGQDACQSIFKIASRGVVARKPACFKIER